MKEGIALSQKNIKKTKNNNKKVALSEKFEFESIINELNELDDVSDLWYFVKSQQDRWVIGSAH